MNMKKITPDKMREIFREDCEGDWEGDNAFQGLVILSKYTQNLIVAAEHDMIYSASIYELIELGITEKDCKNLRDLNWMIQCDTMACFV